MSTSTVLRMTLAVAVQNSWRVVCAWARWSVWSSGGQCHRARGDIDQHHRSVEAEAREILADSLKREPITIVDLLSTDEGADIEFEPERLGLTARTPEL